MTKEKAFELLRKDGSPDAFDKVWNAAYKAGMLRASEICDETDVVDYRGCDCRICVTAGQQAQIFISDAIRSEANHEQPK